MTENRPTGTRKDVRRRIFEVIQIGKETDLLSRSFDIFIVCVIMANIAVMFMETFRGLRAFRDIFRFVELFTVSVFIAEYLLRIWTADFLYPSRGRIAAAWQYMISSDGIVEILTILPFFFLTGFVAFRMLRVVRIFHLFRINANADSFSVIKSVIYEKRNQLASSVFIIAVLTLASSMCMYSAEHAAQPEVFANGFSGIWWSVSTLLTVGYGDIYPVTVTGRIMAIIIAFLGVGVVAVPTGIISAGFVERYQKEQESASGILVSLQTVVVDIDSRWIGKTVAEISEMDSVVIVMVQRGDRTILPRERFCVEMKDVLVVYRD